MIANEVLSARRFLPAIEQREPVFQQKLDQPQGSSFGETLSGFMNDVNNLQAESADLTSKMITGQPVELHDVMIASEKAKTSFNLLLELRNKGVDMYREVSRIQV